MTIYHTTYKPVINQSMQHTVRGSDVWVLSANVEDEEGLLVTPHKVPVWASSWWSVACGPERSPVCLARAHAVRAERAERAEQVQLLRIFFCFWDWSCVTQEAQ